jgi:hypothetical protein
MIDQICQTDHPVCIVTFMTYAVVLRYHGEWMRYSTIDISDKQAIRQLEEDILDQGIALNKTITCNPNYSHDMGNFIFRGTDDEAILYCLKHNLMLYRAT